MAAFVRLATVDQVPANSVRGVIYGDRRIAIYHMADQWYATDNVCTHDEAELSDGWLDPDDCTIECPLHGARFDIATGAVRALPAYQPLPVFAVEIRDSEVWVAVG